MCNTITVGNVTIGGEKSVIIAGPCAIESREQILETAKMLKREAVHILRGGAFKPRTNPETFQGLGEEGLIYLREAGDLTDLPVITELLDYDHFDLVYQYSDIIQVGSRNMYNYALLKKLGKQDKPVLLKRGMSATIHEWIQAAKYIEQGGNKNIILCERGIRSFDPIVRNTLDLSAVPLIRDMTEYPVIVDPSHGTGHRDLIIPMSKAALACGAHGLMIEAHYKNEQALTDRDQTISIAQYRDLLGELKIKEPVDYSTGSINRLSYTL